MSHVLQMLAVAAFPILVVHAAVTDFFRMTIANRVSLALLVAGAIALALSAPSLAEVGLHLAAGAVVLAVGFGCFAFGWMGGGDVKFAAVVAFWLGWSHVLEFAVAASLYGGLLTVLVLFSNRVLDPVPVLKVGFLAGFDEHRRVPYGIALAAAALHLFPTTAWIAVFA